MERTAGERSNRTQHRLAADNTIITTAASGRRQAAVKSVLECVRFSSRKNKERRFPIIDSEFLRAKEKSKKKVKWCYSAESLARPGVCVRVVV